jgi:hypothetical protein
MDANRQYKNSEFTLYFNDAEKLIEVYNAVENAEYSKDTAVEINTLEDALFMDRLNDISFLLDGKLIVLIEHQSTLNENMPLRLLLYAGRVYEKILDGRNIYRQKLIKIPKPDCIVLYNGDSEFPDRSALRLSDAFEDADIPDLLDLTVNVYNINMGRNPHILRRSRSLSDYTAFISRIKGNKAQAMPLEAAINEAIKYCTANGIMVDFLKKHGTEVENMLFTEFNIDDAKVIWQEEAREESMELTAVRMLQDGMEPRSVAKYTGFSDEKILRLSERIAKH